MLRNKTRALFTWQHALQWWRAWQIGQLPSNILCSILFLVLSTTVWAHFLCEIVNYSHVFTCIVLGNLKCTHSLTFVTSSARNINRKHRKHIALLFAFAYLWISCTNVKIHQSEYSSVMVDDKLGDCLTEFPQWTCRLKSAKDFPWLTQMEPRQLPTTDDREDSISEVFFMVLSPGKSGAELNNGDLCMANWANGSCLTAGTH